MPDWAEQNGLIVPGRVAIAKKPQEAQKKRTSKGALFLYNKLTFWVLPIMGKYAATGLRQRKLQRIKSVYYIGINLRTLKLLKRQVLLVFQI
ncbi:hypothetical protein [Paenibacillus periandrae]|uniref:hypothetical protein n=1 Tax=Paenibacillus periandrae TaxID=1761741 RepID=UPI001F09EB7C|nr:hypothetical protein [Paenibacillus periandrae]